MIRRVLIIQTRRCANRFSALFGTRVIAENDFHEKRSFRPIMTLEAKPLI